MAFASFTPKNAQDLMTILNNNTKRSATGKPTKEQEKAAFFLLSGAAASGADTETGAMHMGILMALLSGRAYAYLSETAARAS